MNVQKRDELVSAADRWRRAALEAEARLRITDALLREYEEVLTKIAASYCLRSIDGNCVGRRFGSISRALKGDTNCAGSSRSPAEAVDAVLAGDTDG
jgi:hypothetical protein